MSSPPIGDAARHHERIDTTTTGPKRVLMVVVAELVIEALGV